LTSYCVFLAFELAFVYFLFPETYGKSIEELAFLYEKDARVEQQRRVEVNQDASNALAADDSGDKEVDIGTKREHV
jgi:hypothetical protein